MMKNNKKILLEQYHFKVKGFEKEYNYNKTAILIGDIKISLSEPKAKWSKGEGQCSSEITIETKKDIHLIYPENPFKEKTEDE